MISSEDRFWNVVDGWKRCHRRVVVEISGNLPPISLTYTALVVRALEGVIVFRDVESEKEHSLNFTGAEIRPHSFDPITSVDSYAARWEDGLESVNCLLTELRGFEKPN